MRAGDDTDIGGPYYKFPATRRSAILAASSADMPARTLGLELLIAAYWKPTYKYIRLKWNASNENAKDLTQGFFARAIEKDFFRKYDPSRARFQTFLRTCVDHFVLNERKFIQRQKRCGDLQTFPLDFDGAEAEFRSMHVKPDITDISTDEYFQREWVASLFSLAVDELERECESCGKQTHFLLFEKYDLDDDGTGKSLSYEQLASQFRISVTDVTNYLSWVRRRFRSIALEKLRHLTGSDEEFRAEARVLLGMELS
jgi:DNA-directed RNA polymerase specialized sigma24 family protein